MTERDYADDPNLDPSEKQFSITGTKDRERVRIHSEIGSVTRRICNHPEATIESRRMDNGTVVAVTATLPVACVSVKSQSRANNRWSNVISGGVMD